MEKVILTITSGVEFLQPQDEQLVIKAAKWYTEARKALLYNALQKGEEGVKQAASTLSTLNFPPAPHSRLPDLLTRDVGGTLQALKERREGYAQDFSRWWEEICRVANEKGSQAVSVLKPHVNKLSSLIHQLSWNSPEWDEEAQEVFKELKQIWGVVKQKDHERLKIKWCAEVPPVPRPPRTPKFQRLVFNADGRVSGGSRSNALQIEEREDGDLYLRLQLRDPERVAKKGSYQDVWLRLVIEDEERKQMLKNFAPKYLQLRQDGKRWIAHIVIERENEFEVPQYVYGVDIGARKYLLAAVAIPLNPALPKPPNIAVPSSKFWQIVERVEAEWRKWQQLRTGKRDKEGRVVLKKRKMAWRVLKRKRRMRREVTKSMIAEAVNTFIKSLERPCAIVIEQIKNLHLSPTLQDRKSRWRQRRWAYRFLLEMLRYKAEWEGMRVIEVNPAYTSQTCPRCGERDRNARQGNLFRCTKCRFQHNADFVAAYNITVRGLMKLRTRGRIDWKILTGKPRVL
ncbi:transposase, IS605 OrfB family, central region [Candidatus Fervidibacteria bacterium JGI MDM2 SSWTFF-3-K9]